MTGKRNPNHIDARNLPMEQRPNQVIRKALKAKGLTQRDFARVANMTDSSMTYYMNTAELADNIKAYMLSVIAEMPDRSKEKRKGRH